MEVVVVLEGTVVGEAEVENYHVGVDLMVAKEEEPAVTLPRVEEEVAVMTRAEVEVAVTLRMEVEADVTLRTKEEVGAVEAKVIMTVGVVEEVKTVKGGEEEEVREAVVETPQVIGGQLRYL